MKKLIVLLSLFLIIVPIRSVSDVLKIEKKTIAITFDDGPSKYTKQIVDLFKEYNFKATFFVVGSKVEKNAETLLYTYKNNNEIGNHSYSHIWASHYKDKVVLNEIEKTNELIYKITKNRCTLFRPSYGSINKRLKKLIKEDIIFWSLDSNDWKIKNHKTIASKIVSKVRDGDIILMHDTYERSYNALKIILPILKEMDYQVVTVSTLKEIKQLREKNEYKKN
ncbi:MAG: polysaccharide deacetylase family protein [Bacilli bacterium]